MPADLDLQCLKRKINLGSAGQGLRALFLLSRSSDNGIVSALKFQTMQLKCWLQILDSQKTS